MKALKCDRCGGFYVSDGGKIRVNNEATLDLCPECCEQLKEWLNEMVEKDD